MNIKCTRSQAISKLTQAVQEVANFNVMVSDKELLTNQAYSQSKYEEIESLHQEEWSSENPGTATSPTNLASKYKEEPQYQEVLGSENLVSATSLDSLENTYYRQCKHEEAEPLHQQALNIYEYEKALGSENSDIDTVTSLTNLAHTYYNQGKYEEAELLHQQVLMREKILESEHVNILTNLANTYYCLGKYEEAGSLYQQVYEMLESEYVAE